MGARSCVLADGSWLCPLAGRFPQALVLACVLISCTSDRVGLRPSVLLRVVHARAEGTQSSGFARSRSGGCRLWLGHHEPDVSRLDRPPYERFAVLAGLRRLPQLVPVLRLGGTVPS